MATIYGIKATVKQEQAYGAYYAPTGKEKEAQDHVMQRYFFMKQLRRTTFHYFNDRTIMEYINDNVARLNGYVPPRANELDWEPRKFSKRGKQKLNAIAARVAPQRMRAEMSLYGNQDSAIKFQKEKALNTIYNHTEDIDEADKKFFDATEEVLAKGTVIKLEDFAVQQREIQDIESFDFTTGLYESKKRTSYDGSGVFSMIVPLEKVLIANFYQPDIQMQEDIILYDKMTYNQAKRLFGKWKNWDKVRSKSQMDDPELRTFFEELFPYMQGNDVIIMRYMNRMEDKCAIVINCVLMGGDMFPFPWNHKRYPLSKGVNEVFDNRFFYGMSFIDKIKGEIDTYTAIDNMILKQSLYSLNPVWITNQEQEFEDEFMYPGQVRRVLSEDVTKAMVQMSPEPPSRAAMMTRDNVLKDMDEMTVDPQTQGIAENGITATGSQNALDASIKMLTPFLIRMGWFVRDAAILRISNILQFYGSKEIQGLFDIDEANELREMIFSFEQPNTTLSTGENGKHIVRMVPQKELENPDLMQNLDTEEAMMRDQGSPVEFMYISAKVLTNLLYKVRVIPTSSVAPSKSLEKAMMIELYNLTRRDPSYNQVELQKELLMAYDKDPNRFLSNQTPLVSAEAGPLPQNPPVVNEVLGQSQVRESVPSRMTTGVRTR